MSGISEDISKLFSNAPIARAITAPDINPPSNVPPPSYSLEPKSNAEDMASRQRAASAASFAPGAASSILTGEADPLGIKRQRLLGL